MSDELVIWKYDLIIKDNFTIQIPWDWQFLKIGLQDGEPKLWACVNPKHAVMDVEFKFIGTGHPVPAWKYFDSLIMPPFVWHLFYRYNT